MKPAQRVFSFIAIRAASAPDFIAPVNPPELGKGRGKINRRNRRPGRTRQAGPDAAFERQGRKSVDRAARGIHEIVHRARIEEHALGDRRAEARIFAVERLLECVQPPSTPDLFVLRRKSGPVVEAVDADHGNERRTISQAAVDRAVIGDAERRHAASGIGGKHPTAFPRLAERGHPVRQHRQAIAIEAEFRWRDSEAEMGREQRN